VGSLAAVWTEVPAADDEGEFKRQFYHFFGAGWDEVMVGADRPFAHHRYWDGYFAVQSMDVVQGVTLDDLPRSGAGGARRCSVIVG